jgi:hypothetical protein
MENGKSFFWGEDGTGEAVPSVVSQGYAKVSRRVRKVEMENEKFKMENVVRPGRRVFWRGRCVGSLGSSLGPFGSKKTIGLFLRNTHKGFYLLRSASSLSLCFSLCISNPPRGWNNLEDAFFTAGAAKIGAEGTKKFEGVAHEEILLSSRFGLPMMSCEFRLKMRSIHFCVFD